MTVRKINKQYAKKCKFYELFLEAVRSQELLFEEMEEEEFYSKLYPQGEKIHPFVFGEESGSGFACGLIDEEQNRNFLTLVLVKKQDRRKGIGRELLKVLEKEIFYECRKEGKTPALEISFYNPVTFSWKIPEHNANHPNMPGTDRESYAFEFLKFLGYETFAIQNIYYLSLSEYIPDQKIKCKKEELKKKGITFERYLANQHLGMKEVLKRLGNPFWEKEILSEPVAEDGGRPIIVPVRENRVLGFTGPVDVEKSGRGYFAGIGIDTLARGHGLAKVLFCELCSCLKEEGARFMTLFTGENNPARNIYEAAGFRIVKSFANMRKTEK